MSTKTDGTLWIWGNSNNYGNLGLNDMVGRSSPTQIPGTQWDKINPGFYYAAATKTDGTLWSWGYNSDGNLGQNNQIRYSSPVQVPGTQWSDILTARYTTLAIKQASSY
jgi:alpha-tubulin suppressor-like RCC1 family protein